MLYIYIYIYINGYFTSRNSRIYISLQIGYPDIISFNQTHLAYLNYVMIRICEDDYIRKISQIFH